MRQKPHITSTNFTWKTSNFYGLPEIHKSQHIKEAIKEQNTEYIKLPLPPPPHLKMRPIVDGDMGTKMAPTYATPVMGYLEKEPYSMYEDTFGNKNKDDFVKLFKTFFDDCFIIWEGSEEDLMKFYYLLNDLYEKVKFTMEKDHKKNPFLNILPYKVGGKLHTDIFYKKCTRISISKYLYDSCHPKQTKQNISYSLS